MIKDYYHLLGVPRGASLEEIKSAYRRLAAQVHPDKVARLSSEEQQAANDTMRELNEAIAVFSDPRRRSNYDEMIRYIPERKGRRRERQPAARTQNPPPPPPPTETLAPPPPIESPPAPAPTPAPPPAPPEGTPPGSAQRAVKREEQTLKWQQALERLPLKWAALSVRNWDWALESSTLRRKLLVVYRHWENLSLLSVRTLAASLERLREQHQIGLRPTTVVAVVSFDRLMDAQAVHAQLQGAAVGERGWLKNLRTVVVVFDAQNRRLEQFGSVGDDPELERVLRVFGGPRP